MGFITIGLGIVGVSDIIFNEDFKHDINGIITGFVHYLKEKNFANFGNRIIFLLKSKFIYIEIKIQN